MASTVRMPKVELHVHLDGAFDAGVLHRAAKACLADGKLSEDIAAKVSECGDDVEAFTKLVSCHPEDQSLKAMIDRFVFFLTFVQGNLPIIEELACAFVSRQAAQNVLYTEVRYSPHIMTSVGTYDGDAGANASGSDDMHAQAQAVVEAVTRGLRRGCEKHPGTEIAQILCFLDGKVEWIDSLMQIASTGRAASAAASALPFGAQPLETCPIVGVDIAAGEDHFVPAASTTVNGVWCETGASQSENSAKHRQALRKCREMGLGITNHAGETGIAANVSAAVSDAYGRATRIGHGYAAVAAALEMASASAADGAPPRPAEVAAAFDSLGLKAPLTFECCPTSSRSTRGWTGATWSEHPLAQLYRLRMVAEASGDAASAAALPRVTVNSDDPAVFGSSLTDECELVATGMGLGAPALRLLAADAVEACFLDAPGKQRLRERLQAAWKDYEATSI